MSYTEHDETMDSRSLDGITASGAAESSPVGVSQEAPGVERADPAGDRTEGIAPVLEAGTEEEATAPAAQAEGGGLDPPEAPLPSGESEQTGEAGPETPVEEKPKRKRVSRKKAADSPEDTSGGEAAGEAAQASEEEDTSSGASDDLSAQGGDTPEHDDDEDLETDAFVLSDGGEEMPPTPLEGTGDDDIILDVDREGGVAIGSRRMALAAQRHFFDTIKGGRSIGEKLTCRVLAVGPRRCLVECGGRDMSLSQKDLTYIATPDLRTRYHPGQTLNCVLKEYDRREGQFWVSVKDTVDNPFFGALRRHPIGSRRQAVISGKYGGGVFCTLSDETVCLCHYSTLHSDLDFHVGDTVILAIKQFDYERSLIYGRILSKW